MNTICNNLIAISVFLIRITKMVNIMKLKTQIGPMLRSATKLRSRVEIVPFGIIIFYFLFVGFTMKTAKDRPLIDENMQSAIQTNLLYYRVSNFDYQEVLDSNGNLILNDFSGLEMLIPNGCSLQIEYKVIDTIGFNQMILIEGDHGGYRYRCDNGKSYRTTDASRSDKLSCNPKFLIGLLDKELYFISGDLYTHSASGVLIPESPTEEDLVTFVRYKMYGLVKEPLMFQGEDEVNFYITSVINDSSRKLVVKVPKHDFDALQVLEAEG